MAVERGYEQQVRPGQTAGLPRASAEAFGAGVGDALVGMGRAIARDDDERDNEELAAKSVELEQIKVAIEQDERDGRDPLNPNAPRGGIGYAEGVTKRAGERFDAFLGGIQGKRVRENFMGRIAAYRGDLAARTEGYEIGARAKQLGADTKEYRTALTNRGIQNGGLDEILFDYEDHVTNGVIASPDVKAALLREGVPEIKADFGLAIAGTDPAKAKALARSNLYADVNPAVNERIINIAEAEEARRGAAARAEQAAAVKIEREQLATVAGELDAGAGTVGDRLKLADRYAAIGDTSAATAWRGKAKAFGTVEGVRDWTLPQIDQRMAALDAKRGAGGLSGAEAHEYAGLKDARTAMAGRLDQPGGALTQLQYATGRALTPLNPQDPASLRTRAAEAKAAAGAYGRYRIEPLTATELPIFKDMMEGGPNARLAAVDALQGFGDARVIAGAAAQMAGADDSTFRIAALIRSREVRRDILRGGETLKTAPQVWKESQAQKDFQGWYGRSLSFVGGSYGNDVYQAAKAYYAQRAADGGEQAYNPGRFAEAIETVLGKSDGGTGGVARVRGSLVIVPQGVRPQTLLTSFARAGNDDYARAAGGRVPRWGDGSALTRGQLRDLVPTMIGDGIYGFRGTDGRLIGDDKGGTYAVDYRKLGR